MTKRLAESNLETYEVVEIHRSKLLNAEYNPRILNDSQRRKLKAGLKRHGLVAPVTWNKRTGRIVGGHQRMGVIDSLMATADYTLKVACIDVPESREKELNILLNNQQAAGDWDIEKLNDILKDPTVELEGTGFEAADLYQMFGASPFAERDEDLAAFAEKLADARAQYAQIAEKNKEKNETEFYLVVVFCDYDTLTNFVTEHGLPDNRYQSGEDFTQLCADRKIEKR